MCILCGLEKTPAAMSRQTALEHVMSTSALSRFNSGNHWNYIQVKMLRGMPASGSELPDAVQHAAIGLTRCGWRSRPRADLRQLVKCCTAASALLSFVVYAKFLMDQCRHSGQNDLVYQESMFSVRQGFRVALI